MSIPQSEFIWQNGRLVPWGQATVHVTAHALHYGSAVFEGIRCYDNRKVGPAIFRLRPHMMRMYKSARVYRMTIPWSVEQFEQAIYETVSANGLRSCYIRPLVYRGCNDLGVEPRSCPVDATIIAWPWGQYLGAEALEQGIDVGISSWRRMAPGTLPAAAKIGGHYTNSQLIRMEASEHGYAEGIALDINGYVCEGSGENLFLVEGGVLRTPPRATSILGGITRDSIIQLARDLGIPVAEELISRDTLYMADEVFFTGTAAEITPIRSVDHIQIGTGKRGPITTQLQEAFFAIVQGDAPDRHGWLSPVPGF